jgi:hypothetical protein
MPIATDTRADPNKFPTTVGMVAKKPPLATPLIITKTIRGPRELETGQSTNMLTALSRREANRVFSGPILSQLRPQIRQPIADEKLKAATRPAPALEVIWRELVYNGRKNGGTKSGKVARAPPKKTRINR